MRFFLRNFEQGCTGITMEKVSSSSTPQPCIFDPAQAAMDGRREEVEAQRTLILSVTIARAHGQTHPPLEQGQEA